VQDVGPVFVNWKVVMECPPAPFPPRASRERWMDEHTGVDPLVEPAAVGVGAVEVGNAADIGVVADGGAVVVLALADERDACEGDPHAEAARASTTTAGPTTLRNAGKFHLPLNGTCMAAVRGGVPSAVLEFSRLRSPTPNVLYWASTGWRE
jgi:hypothetical protein